MSDARPAGISAVIIARNEERCIARCLASLAWADEIVVVDAESTDRTPEICQDKDRPWAPKIRFMRKTWAGFREQRTFAMNEARNDWLLVVDADEECTPELAARVRSIVSDPARDRQRAYKIRRVEYFLGKPVRFGVWNPSYQDRFFHREGVKYVNEVHEYPLFPQPAARLEEPLLHAPEFNPEKFLDKMNRYTSIEARDRVNQGRRTNVFRILFAFPAMFLKNYFYYSAYKDGMRGFVISVLEGVSRAVRHVKMWQYQSQSELSK